jgi:hypothetical protein
MVSLQEGGCARKGEEGTHPDPTADTNARPAADPAALSMPFAFEPPTDVFPASPWRLSQ